MISLHDHINNESMIAVNIDTKPFEDIITRLNQMIKAHDAKLEEVDKKMENLCTKDEFHNATDPIVASVQELSGRSSQALDQSEKLTKESIEMREKLTQMINDKFNDMLVTTQLSQKNSADNIESKIDSIMQTSKQALITARSAQNSCTQQESLIKETKSNIQVLGERVHHVNSEFIKFVNSQKGQSGRPVVRLVPQEKAEQAQPLLLPPPDNTELIEQIEARTKEQIDVVQSSVADLLNDRLTSLQKAIEVAVMHPTSDNSPKLNEVWAVTSQNRAGLLNAMTEQSLLSRRVDVLQQMIDNIQQNPSNPESPNRPMLSSIMAHQNAANRASVVFPLDNDIRAKEQTKLASTIDQLGGKMEGALQDILRIKSAVNRNEKDVRDVVLAIIDEFKLIRTNASGLEHLPPLNLATCVPSFFNNPSFTFDRDNGDSESASDTDRSDVDCGPRRGRRDDRGGMRRDDGGSEYGQSSRISSPRFHVKMVSGLMHLVSRPEPRPHELSKSLLVNQEEKEVEQEDEEVESTARTSVSETVPNAEEQPPSEPSPKSPATPVKVEQSVVHVFDRQGLDELKANMEDFHKNKDELMSVIDRKVDRVIVEKVLDKFRVILSGLNNRVEEMAGELEKLPKVDDVQELSDLVQKTAERVNQMQTTTTIPTHTFGNTGDFIMGEDGGAFIGDKGKNGRDLPPLKDRQRKV